jgi:hypothetical protein
MVRDRPSGLKAACGTAARRPAAGPDPGASAVPGAQETKGQAEGLPPGRTAPEPRNRLYRGHGTVIYRHRCDDPLNPRPQSLLGSDWCDWSGG